MLKTKISGGIMEIPTAHISPDPEQPRKEFTPEYIAALGASIKAEGLLQPITVRPDPDRTGYYRILAGECRWRAHCHAGIQTVRCIVTRGHEDGAKRFRAQVMENMGRKQMTIREEANAVARMKDEFGDSDEAIGQAVGLSTYRVRNVYLLTKLSPNAWRLLENGSINRDLAEYAVGKIPLNVAEDLLIRGAGKSRSAAAAILGAWEAEQQQASLEMAFEKAGVTAMKSDLVKSLTLQLLQVSAAVEKLPPGKHKALARKLGNEIAANLSSNATNRRGAAFLSKLAHHVSVVLEG